MDVAIPSGLGEARNALVVRAADAVVAIGGGYGTLSEIALALKAGKRVVGLDTWDIEGVVAAPTPRPPSRPCSAIRSPRLAASWPASPTPRTSTPCARTPRASRVASTCPATRAGSARTPGWWTPSASALELDIPALTYGVDVGEEPTPFAAAQQLAAEAWGASRTWWLVNGASQGNHVALLALGHQGTKVVTQRNAHSSTIDALVMSGLRPTFVAPELDPELHIAHCMTPEALDQALRDTPDAVGATVVSPTYFGAVADVAGLVEVAHSHGVPLVVDEAWGAHLPFHEDLPAHALSLGADLVISSTHKIVGSLTQSAMIHLGHGDLISEGVVDRCVTLVESTSPNSLLFASLDTARRSAATGAASCSTRR